MGLDNFFLSSMAAKALFGRQNGSIELRIESVHLRKNLKEIGVFLKLDKAMKVCAHIPACLYLSLVVRKPAF